MKSILALLLVVVLLGVCLFAGYTIYQRRQEPVEPVSASQPQSASSSAVPQNPKNEIQKGLQGSTTDPEVLEKLMYEIKKNPDTVGWLTVPGTSIDNSVVQYHNNTYYLRRTERGADSQYGCYFADFECSVGGRDVLSPNTVIYGHSDLKDNKDGPKFSQLFRYTDQAFAQQNNVITLSTPEDKLEWEIFAVFYTDISFDYIKVDNTPEEQQSIIDTALALSVHDFGVKPSSDNHILTLSTCSVRDGKEGNNRFVVMSRLKM